MMREQRFGNEPIIVGIISAGIRDYVGIHSAREYIERRNKVDAELRVPIQQRTVRPLRWQGPSRPLGLLSGIHSLPLARPSVFIVHGHDDALTNDVARTLEKLGLDPIILHEKADQGQTIIEKLELHADVQYAVVLITPDDDHVDNKTKTSVKRARQNVILELGFFLAHLGRERVFILRKDDPHLELPSDYQGVI
ncbi:MAG: nucleotide-binding protein [Candidatus Thermoplasmatota archaeon]